jgi:glutaminase
MLTATDEFYFERVPLSVILSPMDKNHGDIDSDQKIADLRELMSQLAEAKAKLDQQMAKNERSRQEMREAMTIFLERFDRFTQGRNGNGHQPA